MANRRTIAAAAVLGGGGGECSPTLTNPFSGNQAGYGGGMYNDGDGGVSSPH